MSHPNMNDRESALDALVREAKQELTPEISDAAFASMEERILARMAEERAPLVDEVKAAGNDRRGRVLRIGALVLAAAAAVAVVTKNEPGGARIDGAPGAQVELSAGSLRGTEGAGEVRVGGQPASAGHALRAGDVVEADGARALLERPRKVAWLLEARSEKDGQPAERHVARARVRFAGESLIVGLEDGAVEAQVTPVPSGEAFAVDVAAGTSLVRVAVHGTHLRVSRTGSRVVVDLTEGIVSIGVPPRTGSTYGTLVTAPSHVEFDATDLDHTLKIDHTPAAVRAPVSLAQHEAPVAARTPEPQPARDVPVPVAPATVPRPTSVARAAEPSPLEAPARAHDGDAPGTPPAASALPPREAIAAAVRACAAARSRPENVRVTMTSSLKLKIAAGGEVETAQFDPPLLPEIQACAATAIYKAKITDAAAGTVVVPIDVTY